MTSLERSGPRFSNTLAAVLVLVPIQSSSTDQSFAWAITSHATPPNHHLRLGDSRAHKHHFQRPPCHAATTLNTADVEVFSHRTYDALLAALLRAQAASNQQCLLYYPSPTKAGRGKTAHHGLPGVLTGGLVTQTPETALHRMIHNYSILLLKRCLERRYRADMSSSRILLLLGKQA